MNITKNLSAMPDDMPASEFPSGTFGILTKAPRNSSLAIGSCIVYKTVTGGNINFIEHGTWSAASDEYRLRRLRNNESFTVAGE